MIDLNPERVCNIIQLAREFHAKEEVVIPEVPNNPGDNWACLLYTSPSPRD